MIRFAKCVLELAVDVSDCNIMALLLHSAVMNSPKYVRFAFYSRISACECPELDVKPT